MTENPEQSDLFGHPSFWQRRKKSISEVIGLVAVTLLFTGGTVLLALLPCYIAWWAGAFK